MEEDGRELRHFEFSFSWLAHQLEWPSLSGSLASNRYTSDIIDRSSIHTFKSREFVATKSLVRLVWFHDRNVRLLVCFSIGLGISTHETKIGKKNKTKFSTYNRRRVAKNLRRPRLGPGPDSPHGKRVSCRHLREWAGRLIGSASHCHHRKAVENKKKKKKRTYQLSDYSHYNYSLVVSSSALGHYSPQTPPRAIHFVSGVSRAGTDRAVELYIRFQLTKPLPVCER